LSKADIAFEADLVQSVTTGNYVRFGKDFLDVFPHGQADTFVHELVHVAQGQILGTVKMAWRGARDCVRSGLREKHYTVSAELAKEGLDTIDIVDPRYDLEAIADHFSDLVWKTGRYRMFR
jgi:hypothetical protein